MVIRRRIDGSPIVPIDPGRPVKRVILVRHGESMGQAARSKGWDRQTDRRLLDCRLTFKGVSQALALRKLLQPKDVDSIQLVVCSPLTRALETALLAFPEKSMLVGYDMRELGTKVPENTPRPISQVLSDLHELLQERPKDASLDETSLQPRDWPKDYSPSVIKRDRIRNALHYLYHEREETTIAIVCHYNVIRSAIIDGAKLRPMNAVPIPCMLYSNGDLLLCKEGTIGTGCEKSASL